MIKVELTIAELWIASIMGSVRRVSAIQRGAPDSRGYDGKDPWTVDVLGCAAEIAVAKKYNLYWNGRWGSDAGPYEVKAKREQGHRLIIPLKDHKEYPGDDKVCVSVMSRNPVLKPPFLWLVGWVRAGEVKESWIYDGDQGRPAYFVPNEELHNMETLPR